MKSPYMNTSDVATYLRFVDEHGAVNVQAAREWLDRHKVPTKRRGRAVLVHVDDLEAALKTRRK